MVAGQTINRAIHDTDHPFVMTRREAAQDTGLSYEATGMLVFLLSKPDDWKIIPQTLVRQDCNLKKVQRLFNELIVAGYMKRAAMRDELGRITEWTYQVFEEPQPHVEKSTCGVSNKLISQQVAKRRTYKIKNKKQNTETTQTTTELPAKPVPVVITPAVVSGSDGQEIAITIIKPATAPVVLPSKPVLVTHDQQSAPPPRVPPEPPAPTPEQQLAQAAYEKRWKILLVGDEATRLFDMLKQHDIGYVLSRIISTNTHDDSNRPIKKPMRYMAQVPEPVRANKYIARVHQDPPILRKTEKASDVFPWYNETGVPS